MKRHKRPSRFSSARRARSFLRGNIGVSGDVALLPGNSSPLFILKGCESRFAADGADPALNPAPSSDQSAAPIGERL